MYSLIHLPLVLGLDAWTAFYTLPPCCRYKQALRSCPSCPPEVRLGIAACCLKMGNTDKAELAYKRTLELAPDCTPALLGLAVLKLHISSEEEVRGGVGVAGEVNLPVAAPRSATLAVELVQGIREGSRLLAQAFEQDPDNPFVLLLLAHFCLRQGFSDKVWTHEACFPPALQVDGRDRDSCPRPMAHCCRRGS